VLGIQPPKSFRKRFEPYFPFTYDGTKHTNVANREVPGLGLTNEDVSLLRGWIVIFWLGGLCDILAQGLIGLIEYSYQQDTSSFFGSLTNFWVKRAWPRAVLGWVTVREVFSGAHE
jgi:hypothetical protein